MRRARVVVPVVLLALLATGCPKASNHIHEAAKASDRIATLTNSLIDLKRDLGATGQITREEELKLTETLLVVAQRGKQFNDFAKTLKEDTPQTRLDLATAFNGLTQAINRLSNEAIFPVKNPESKKKLLAVLNSINASVIIIDAALRG